MKKTVTAILAACMAISALASAPNPVIRGFFPDPSICRVGDDYYLVNSSFQYFPGVPIFHSRDLVNWEQIGNVLDRDSQLRLPNARSWGGIYAPTIRHHDGVFYMIVTNVSDKGNLIVQTKDPAGPWSDPVWVEIGGIDPSLFWDEDGTCWYTGTCDGSIVLAKIDPDSGRLLSEQKPIFHGTGGRYPEAPHIYKKDKWYYLLLAEGGTEMGHGEVAARSRRIDGPYTPCPHNPIMTHFRQSQQDNPIQGIGHADFVQTPSGEWYLVCLGFRRMGGDYHLLGRETFLAPVEWPKNGWPAVNGDGHVPTVLDLPAEVAPKTRYDYDFTRQTPGHEWVYMRNPERTNYSFGKNGMTLKASPCGLDDDSASPTFIARRQQDQHFEAVACMSGDATEAGITVFQDCGSHYDAYFTSDGVTVRYRLGSITSETHVACNTQGRIWLKVKGGEYTYTFSYSLDGKEYADISAGDIKWLSTEAAGGFTGVVLGLYATGSGSATVESFSYISLDDEVKR